MCSNIPLGSSETEETVPCVEWERLEDKVLALDACPTLLYVASLVMPDDTREPVEVCSAPCPRRIALVLQALDGVEGVPKVYGMTPRGTEALVLSRCYGCTLDVLVAGGDSRNCLLALLRVCKVISWMHYHGISYGNLWPPNIVVDVREDSNLEVSLVDFHLAKINADDVDIKTDERMMFSLAKTVVIGLNGYYGDSIQDEVYQIFVDAVDGFTLVEIAMLLCGLINHHPTVIAPPYKPVMPSSSAKHL